MITEEPIKIGTPGRTARVIYRTLSTLRLSAHLATGASKTTTGGKDRTRESQKSLTTTVLATTGRTSTHRTAMRTTISPKKTSAGITCLTTVSMTAICTIPT